MAKTKKKVVEKEYIPPNLPEINKKERYCFMKWYEATEHLPETNRLVLGYTEIFGTYYICYFHPINGWRDAKDDESLLTVTHWLDADLPFPFPFRNEYNETIASKHGYTLPRRYR